MAGGHRALTGHGERAWRVGQGPQEGLARLWAGRCQRCGNWLCRQVWEGFIPGKSPRTSTRMGLYLPSTSQGTASTFPQCHEGR